MAAYQSNVVGAIVCVIASITSNVGVNLFKEVHTQESKKENEKDRVSYYCRKTWWLGFFLQTAGAAGDAVAVGIGEVSLIAAVGGATTLLTNIVLARLWHKEKLVATDLVGVFFVIGGAVLIAIMTPKEKPYDLKQLMQLFVQKPFIVYAIVLVVFMSITLLSVAGSTLNRHLSHIVLRTVEPHLVLASRQIRKLRRRVRVLERQARADQHRRMASCSSHSDSPDPDGITPLSPRIGVGTPKHYEKTELTLSVRKADMYIYCACSGVWGSAALLLMSFISKTVLQIIQTGDVEPLEDWYTYLFIAALVLCVKVQTSHLNRALQMGEIMTAFPVFQAFWISFGTIGGSVLYNDFHNYVDSQWIMLLVAVALMILGVYFLWKHPSKQDSEAKSKKMEPESIESGLLFAETVSGDTFDRYEKREGTTPFRRFVDDDDDE